MSISVDATSSKEDHMLRYQNFNHPTKPNTIVINVNGTWREYDLVTRTLGPVHAAPVAPQAMNTDIELDANVISPTTAPQGNQGTGRGNQGHQNPPPSQEWIGGIPNAVTAVLVLAVLFGVYKVAEAQGWFKPAQQQNQQADNRGGGANNVNTGGGNNPQRAAQQARCDEQAKKRRDLGIDSRVVWDNDFTCRATGGHVQSGRM